MEFPLISKHIRGLLATVSVAWVQQAAAAGSIEVDAEKLMSLSLLELINVPVVTASRQEETRDRTPAHIVVVTRVQIRERRYKNLADLLDDMPGVDFMRGTKSAAYNNMTVQGYSGPNKLVVMQDGVRIGNPAGGAFPIAENIGLYQAKQVEFLYGPAAALYGADAVAGVVNIITERATEASDSWLSVGVGNFGTRETSFMSGVKGDGPVALSVGGHWQASDRAPLQNFYAGEFAKKDARTLAAPAVPSVTVMPAAARADYAGDISSHSLFARMDVGQDITLGFQRNYFRSLTSTGDRPDTAEYLSDAPWVTQTDTVYGKYRFAASPDLAGELVIDYSRQDVTPVSRYVNVYTAFSSGYEYTRDDRLSIEQNLNWKLSDRHRVQAGVGYQHFYAIEAHSLPSPYDTSKGPADQAMFYRNTSLPLTIYNATYNNVSAYAQLQSQWDAAFSTMAGLRVDDHSAYGRSVNPRLGAVWRVNEQHLLKALYGQAFRAPSPEESLSYFGVFSGAKSGGLYVGTGFRIPNLNLEPEKARTLSLTWDWRPRQDFNWVANLYRSEIRNLIVTQASSDVGMIPGATLVGPQTKGNAGRQTQQGLDLMAQWRFKIDSAWTGDLWSSASWVGGRIDEGDGKEWDIPYVAAFKFKLGTTLRYRDRVSITPQILSVGDTSNGRKLDANAPPARRETPSYTITNLHIGWHKLADGKATLWFDINNLFDRRYYAAGGSGSGTFFDMPQQPRSWVVSLEYRF